MNEGDYLANFVGHDKTIPRWLCWLLGHYPTRCARPDLDEMQCGCDRNRVSGITLLADDRYRRHMNRWRRSRWDRFCRAVLERCP